MLVVDIKLLPYGQKEYEKTIARLAIGNVYVRHTGECDYAYAYNEPNPVDGSGKIEVVGEIDNYFRYAPVAELVSTILDDVRETRNSHKPLNTKPKIIEILKEAARIDVSNP